MGYRIAVCDDDAEQLTQLTKLAADWGGDTAAVCSFLSAESFLFAYAADKTFDILLLDIEMPKISGLELARRVRAAEASVKHPPMEIIFVTSHFEFVTEGYEVDALHYLVKPIRPEKLAEVLTKAARRRAVEPPSVRIAQNGETVRLYESEILYIEAFLHDIAIHTPNRTYQIKESISVFAGKLSGDFYRIHRSYLVSLRHVNAISRKTVTVGEAILPLARGKYDDIHRAFIRQN